MKKLFLRVLEVYKPFRVYVVYSLVLLVILEALALFPAYIFGEIINNLSAGEGLKQALFLALLAFVISISSNLVGLWKDRVEVRNIDFSVNNSVTRQTLNRLLARSVGQDRARNSGKTLSIVRSGESSLQQLAFESIYNVAPGIAKVIVTTVAIFLINLYLGIVTLVGLFLFIVITIAINRKLRSRIKNIRDQENQLGKERHEIVRNMTLVKLSSQQERVEKEFMDHRDDLDEYKVETWLPYFTLARLRNAVLSLTRLAILGMSIWLVYSNSYEVGFVVVAMMWTNHTLGAIGPLGHLQRRLTRMISDVKKFFEALDVKEIVIVPKNPTRLGKVRGEIEFRNVSFSYPREKTEEDENESGPEKTEDAENKPILTDVSFKIAPGEKVAIVGATGSGKTTIINLLLRAYDPDQGQILVDGVDLRLIDLHEFRSSVGLVEQQIELFHKTLRYNLLFGMNGEAENVTEEMLTEVAKKTLIDRFSGRLTEGFDTIIGENGILLSGGERQRVGIARALIKDPAILVFDEATSSLDVESEELIKESIDNASRGRTTIVIAHRLSTVVDSDRIFVVEKGDITATGTHEELLESSPTYYGLVSKQVSLIG